MPEAFAFDRFILDTRERRLSAAGEPVELNTRYLDALALLVGAQGRLISKDEFLASVWRGVPVTDEALTQCIRTLRRQLGDDAARPRFIETIAKHGYRFIAPVEAIDGGAPVHQVRADAEFGNWQEFATISVAGTFGGAVAGLIGGLIYGFAMASDLGGGAISSLLVLLAICGLVAMVGGAGVSLAIATVVFAPARSLLWMTVAGAGGGLFVGAFVKLLGLDAFSLLIGQSPGNITGGPEGLVLGAAVGLGAWIASRFTSIRRGVALTAACGAAAGLAISLLGGRLMLGSLDLLQRHLPQSHLRLEAISGLFGEPGFGPLTQAITSMLEGALFAACVVAAIRIALRRRNGSSPD
jgi:DNA-binding winged helix-turn-helix (wHTH) protein